MATDKKEVQVQEDDGKETVEQVQEFAEQVTESYQDYRVDDEDLQSLWQLNQVLRS